jgi:hypothetical protein
MGTTPGRAVRSALCALAVAAPLLAGCAGADGEAEPAGPSTGSQSASEDAAADLEESAPDGKYAASYVLESSDVPGFKSKGTYAFTFDECSDTRQQDTVFSDFKNGCEPAGRDRQRAKFSLVLERT